MRNYIEHCGWNRGAGILPASHEPFRKTRAGCPRYARAGSLRRGSVLVLVIGLLTIIAMLGATFLLISRLDRQQAQALARNAAAEPIAQGLLEQVQELLREDLYIEENTDPTPDEVYGDVGAGTPAPTADEQIRRFTDYPSETDGYDGWLSSMDPTDPSYHPSNVLGTTTLLNIDTDGDGTNDAQLFDTGVFNADGREYQAAVRVIDLGGLICLNTGGEAAVPADTLIAPVYAGLMQYLDAATGQDSPTQTDTAYDNIQAGRNPSGRTLEEFYAECASQLFEPDSSYNYLPFAAGDELYLRWPGTVAPEITTGRVAAALTDLPTADRRNLTSFNCSRNLVRRPAEAETGVQPAWYTLLDLSDNGELDDNANPEQDQKKRLYRVLVDALYGGSGASDDGKKKAAHFVANLWAYLDGQIATEAYAFEAPTSGSYAISPTFTAYGVVPQPVIAEAYAYNIKDSGLAAGMPPENDHGWAYAVELYNPTNRQITLNAGGTAYYKLVQGSSDFPFPAGATLEPAGTAGDRVVVYTFGGQVDDGLGGRRPAVIGDFFPTMPGNWYEWTSSPLDFSNQSDSVRLIRDPDGTGSHTILVDEVAGADFGYLIADKQSQPNPPDTEELCNGRRDDSDANRRALVAKMADYPIGSMTAHRLGLENDYANWTPAEQTTLGLAPTDVFGGFEIPIRDATNGVLTSGELLRIFITGPSRDAGGAEQTLPGSLYSNYRVHVSRGRLELVDATGAASSVVCTSPYPTTVPQACILGELASALAPDITRSDEAGPPEVYSRVYGRVNINTATEDVLRRLPWTFIDINGDGTEDANEVIDVDAIVDYIIAYREKGIISGGPNYLTRPGDPGFLTPGQIAIPLADYAITILTSAGVSESDARYLNARDELYNDVANLVTVNSDVYAVYIYVELEDGIAPGMDYRARYLGVIDRSNCRADTDTPAVLLFTPIK